MINRQALTARAVSLSVVLLAFALRLWEVDELALWGDSAYSVYTARQSLAEIIFGRVRDSHPPLYYSLLHWSIGLLGQSEFSLRLPSVAFGLLTVPLAFAAGRRMGGRTWIASGAALLVATSPMLVYFSRLPRMYSLAPFLALLSTYLLHQALEGRRWAWLGYFGATLAALYTHYYALLLLLGQGAYALMRLRRERRHLGPWLTIQSGLALAYGPWLLFAARSQAQVTAGIISQAPAAQGLAGFVEQIWLPFHSGITLEAVPAWLLSLVFLATIVLGAAGWWRRGRSLPPMALLLLICFAVAIALSYLAFLALPYAVRPRFFILWFPGYLVFLAWLIGQSHRLHRLAPAAAVAAIIAANGYALQDSYFVERRIQEPDIIMVTEHLERAARPGDAVIFHAFWQIGYFTTHFRGEPLAIHTLDQVMAEPALLEGHERVWLSLYGAARHESQYPLEEKLDRSWHKALEMNFGPNRLGLYGRPLRATQAQAPSGGFLDATGRPFLWLEEFQTEPGPFAPGSLVRFSLGWLVLADGEEPLTFRLQLVDRRGNRLARRDAEPSWGANPTSGWKKDEVHRDRPALLIPGDLPRGQYTVVASFYPLESDEGRRLPATGPAAREDNYLTLGSIEVLPQPLEAIGITHRREARWGEGLRLLGYSTSLDRYAVASQKEIRPTQGEIIILTFPRQGYRPGDEARVTLFWQAERPLTENYIISLQLATQDGQAVIRDDGIPRSGTYPTNVWPPGDVVVDERRLPLPPSLAPGEYTLRVSVHDKTEEAPPTADRGNGLTLGRINLQP